MTVTLVGPAIETEMFWTHGPEMVPEIWQFVVQVRTVNWVALLVAVATPSTVTMTFPVPVAPAGTVTVMLVGLQLVGVAVTPLTVTVLDPCACVVPKFVPVMVIGDPTGPEFWLRIVMAGVANTAKEAVLLVLPVPPSVDVTALVVLLKLPAPVPVKLTLKVHDPPAAKVPPDKLTEAEAATAVIVPLPHEPVRPLLGLDTCRPATSVSVKATPLNDVEELGLLTVKVSEVAPLSTIAVAPKALLMVGGAFTVRVAVLLVAPAPLCVEEIAPVVFTLAPAVVPVTLTLSVQLLLVATAAPVNETLDEPATAVAVPPQVFAIAGVAATTSPEVRASLNATPVRATVLTAGLVMVKVSDVVPFS